MTVVHFVFPLPFLENFARVPKIRNAERVSGEGREMMNVFQQVYSICYFAQSANSYVMGIILQVQIGRMFPSRRVCQGMRLRDCD